MEHPNIRVIQNTGYPIGFNPMKEENYYCECCGKEITRYEDMYSDEMFDKMCRECLLDTHIIKRGGF